MTKTTRRKYQLDLFKVSDRREEPPKNEVTRHINRCRPDDHYERQPKGGIHVCGCVSDNP